MNIKNIKKLSSGKYQILFENGEKLTTYDEILLKDKLLYKKELSTLEINNINKENEYYNIYSNVIKFINKKMRSLKEINTYLDKYDMNSDDKEKLISRLTNNNFINDTNFIKAFISDRMYLSNDGPFKIRTDLLKHNICEEDIDNELDKISRDDVLDKLRKLINKKIKSSKGSNYNVKQKIYYEMYNLGYSKELVDLVYVVDNDDTLSLTKDFNKVYNDVIKKETEENKIYLKVKQKLYQKGYSLDKIAKIINEKRY